MQVTSKGQVTIPQEIRNRLGLLPNTEVEFELAGDHARIRKAQRSTVASSRGRSGGRSPSRVRRYPHEHRPDSCAHAWRTPHTEAPQVTPVLAGLAERLSACRGVLVDSNVLLDVISSDPTWSAWSASALAEAAEYATLLINPIVYAEVSIAFSTIEALDAVLPTNLYQREALPWESGFLAGKCFLRYRRLGGARTSPLPDFYIGAHAAISHLALLTRDAARYRTYFPRVTLLSPSKRRPHHL